VSSASSSPTRRSGWPTCPPPAARERTIIVLGHEQTGIPAEALDLLDVAVEIPMVGSGASLNVAVAGSLVLYRLAGFL
jgi:tRNA (guanosine-2'-O-)-methyltransferase